jgi:hypothetical protein
VLRPAALAPSTAAWSRCASRTRALRWARPSRQFPTVAVRRRRPTPGRAASVFSARR